MYEFDFSATFVFPFLPYKKNLLFTDACKKNSSEMFVLCIEIASWHHKEMFEIENKMFTFQSIWAKYKIYKTIFIHSLYNVYNVIGNI